MAQGKKVIYRFYRHVPHEEDQYIGSLTERRKNQERITHASIMNWAKIHAFKDVFEERIYFDRWEI